MQEADLQLLEVLRDTIKEVLDGEHAALRCVMLLLRWRLCCSCRGCCCSMRACMHTCRCCTALQLNIQPPQISQ